MAKHSTQFEATAGGMKLTNAILLYQGEAAPGASRHSPPRVNSSAFASIHPVEHGPGQPMLGTGAPLSRAHLRQWAEALGRTAAPEILPENVLISHAEMLAWWVPEHVRTAYFALSGPTTGLKALAQRTTVQVPYPAHLFIATRGGLGVYALPANVRPTADTIVLHSPVLNVFLDGKLCWGNIATPKYLTIASMQEYEAAVFDSWSTHPNAGQEQTITGKGGLVRLWDELAARKSRRFPVKRLRPFNPAMRRSGAKVEAITLGRLVAGLVRT